MYKDMKLFGHFLQLGQHEKELLIIFSLIQQLLDNSVQTFISYFNRFRF